METPLWLDNKLPRFNRVAKSGKFDVIVIGGGITGITAAYLLKKAGQTVALVERDRLAQVDTGHTTAHLTCVTDLRLKKLVQHFGRDHARAAWDAGLAAIQQIEQLVGDEKIDCDFRHVPGFLHTSLLSEKDESKDLKEEAELAMNLGFDAKFLDRIPFIDRPGIRFANQAKFHPLKYLSQLVKQIPGDGCQVYEQSEVTKFQEEPLGIRCNGQLLKCGYIVIATHVPLMGNTKLTVATLFQSKLAPYSSYVIGAKLPKEMLPEASFWDTSDPYYYLRVERGTRNDYAIFGGADHKTGQSSDTEKRFVDLESTLLKFVPQAKCDRRWSGQVIETNDGLPYIGETAERQFAATGFAGNGMTFGTLAAMMARDAALGQKNPWQDLFSVNRKKLRGGTWNYVKENLDYPYYYLKDRLISADEESLKGVLPGQGKIVSLKSGKVAAYRDQHGEVTAVSAYCTHMGCIVHWNRAEVTWDCPCHGSRFRPNGEVLAGPAESPLPRVAHRKPSVGKKKAKLPKRKNAKTKRTAKRKATRKRT